MNLNGILAQFNVLTLENIYDKNPIPQFLN
jgi:hypothetical protein